MSEETTQVLDDQKTILVVEDEQPLSRAITGELQKRGLHTVSARTADQALDYLKTLEKIDVVWLDHYLLGNRSGLELIAELKSENSQWKDIPVFVVSNSVTDEKIQTYIELGATKYFVKSTHRLNEIIDDVLKHYEAE